MTRRLDLTHAHCASVHDWLAGRPCALDGVVAATNAQAAGGGVSWRFPVRPETIHMIEAAFLAAKQCGAGFELDLQAALDARQQAFLDDFSRHCLGVDDGAPVETLGWRDYLAAAREAADLAIRLVQPRRAMRAFPAPMSRVVIIGAYGGDHVGDAAILGGVLLGLHQTYGVRSAVVMSHRPDHTRRLAAGLDTPVEVTVETYTPALTDRMLADADGLVLAGGPLMDLPRVLLKHLSAAATARRLGLPFIVDRVGVGPFRRGISRRLASMLLDQAASVSVRSAGSGQDPVMLGRNFVTASDPAFDYLATRQSLTRLTPAERSSIDALLTGAEGRPLVGVNVRPIRHSWAKQGADFARAAEDAFLANLVDAMAEITARSATPPVFVFFPMNPVQFGMSDLQSAFRIQQALKGRADMRVWQADPDVDGVLALLRRLQAVAAMRLHACIFSASQNLPLVGVDYYPGQGGKVEQLFADRGAAADVTRIDTFDADWFVGAVLSKLEAAQLAPAET